MAENQLRSYGVLLLRLALGTMFIAHSIVYMLMTLTLTGTTEFFVSIGLPAWLAYVTFVAEAVGGILLILGIQVRWVALVLSPILLGAVWGSFGKRLAVCIDQRRVGISPIPIRSLHRPSHAWRRRLRTLPVTVYRSMERC